jgi:hypothetical protein
MDPSTWKQPVATPTEVLLPEIASATGALALTPAGQAALAVARALARKARAPATRASVSKRPTNLLISQQVAKGFEQLGSG